VSVVRCEKVKVHGELVAGIVEEMVTNKNGLGIQLKSKNFKAPLGEIEVVVHVKKMASH